MQRVANLSQAVDDGVVDGIGINGREPDGDVGDQPLEAEMGIRRCRQAGLEIDPLRDVENQRDGVDCRALIEQAEITVV